MESSRKSAIALRSQVVPPDEVVKLAKIIDQSIISHLFLPDISISFDSLELSSACLGVTKGLHVGSGVFRPLEHDVGQLERRLQTLQAISDNRYILGAGTGNPGENPGNKVAMLLQRLDELRSGFAGSEYRFPETYIATLRPGIARRVAGKCDGIILNFCPPEFAKTVVSAVRESFDGKIEISCYLKVFYSNSEATAKKLAIEEFVKYNTIPHYHSMFETIGVSEDILIAARSLESNNLIYPESLSLISPVNPSVDALRSYVSRFREAGVSLPCVYPYFSPNESFEFKENTTRSIISASE